MLGHSLLFLRITNPEGKVSFPLEFQFSPFPEMNSVIWSAGFELALSRDCTKPIYHLAGKCWEQCSWLSAPRESHKYGRPHPGSDTALVPRIELLELKASKDREMEKTEGWKWKHCCLKSVGVFAWSLEKDHVLNLFVYLKRFCFVKVQMSAYITSEWKNEWLNEWRVKEMNRWVTKQMKDQMNDRRSDWRNECMHAWMNLQTDWLMKSQKGYESRVSLHEEHW